MIMEIFDEDGSPLLLHEENIDINDNIWHVQSGSSSYQNQPRTQATPDEFPVPPLKEPLDSSKIMPLVYKSGDLQDTYYATDLNVIELRALLNAWNLGDLLDYFLGKFFLTRDNY